MPTSSPVNGPGAVPLPLDPLLTDPLRDLLQERTLLHDLVRALGSPLNLVLPQAVATNVDRFRAVYRDHGLSGHVYYAHKANRSSALVRHLASTPARLDVASLGELQHGLGAGFTPDRLMVTGPKGPELLWLAARTGAVVNVDSVAEIAALAQLVRAHGLPAVPVLVRLTAFPTSGTTMLRRTSRFGIDHRDLATALDLLVEHRDVLHMRGVAYHLDTIGLDEKITALEGCVLALDEAVRRGLDARVVDVGGGFGVDYLAQPDQWEAWTSALTAAVLGRGPAMTWDGHGYGLRSENGVLRGALGLYPASRPLAGPRYLDALLSATAPTLGRPLATLLQEGLYDLWTEPGRAMVDQAGAVLATVLEVRDTPTGHCLVRLAANARDISTEDHGVLMDPVLVPAAGREPDGPAQDQGPVGAYLLGNLCLEADLLSRRAVRLPRRPAPGDLLAFANTAGYFMDFNADHALHQPVARTVALTRDHGAWDWSLDEQYWPAPPPTAGSPA
ncbi:diaminopimelate decarboxylase [Cellulomonas bogoriensis 69B4 = DSM 16987]|uniref:Diaminopimelate decarboxylase n=2 Tax=Cellulomonas bogoriensis TaxID=301388 RepID=A0A0A0BXL1_9CELL|nr:diaminopimelate decarboxylase [Cellulomonas bogoriensis 69B4 = DSM 16987]